ncbi:serine/threonine protein kinase [Clostridium sp. AM58-1XD]|nr:serine/threonine protein kinase [Clostridium sp. AM58-1XD]
MGPLKKISKRFADYGEFQREAVILKNIRHPGIPVIYDLEEDEDNYYLIEEYLEGVSLFNLIRNEGPLSKAMTVSIGIQICRLVYYLHSAKPNPILYLDLQPKNLLLCHDTVKLIDFGQAVFLQEAGCLKKRYGTAGYAAPEQYTDETLDERTDMFAIGKLMYFLFKGTSLENEGNEKRAEFRAPGLMRIISRCLASEKEKRYPSVYALCEELEKIQKDGGNKNHLSSLTIAFAGVKSGVGTTHLAIGLSQYLKLHGYPNLYEEKNKSDAVRTMAGYFCARPDSDGIIKIAGLYMKPFYGQAVRFKEPEGMFRIQDYGTDWEALGENRADALIIVNGGKWWDIAWPRRYPCMLDGSGKIFIICNLSLKDLKISREKRQEQAVYMKAPYFESPFDLSAEAEYFYRSLMDRIWNGQHRRERRYLPRLWLKRAIRFIRLIFAG